MGATDAGTPPPNGVAAGTDELFAAVYDRLKTMVAKRRGASAGDTLDTTGVVHELYLRLQSGGELSFEHPSQFFAYAARALRHLLVDRARHRLSERAGGQWAQITLTASDERLVLDSANEVIALDLALDRLAAVDARAARVVELVYFAGVSLHDAGDLLGTSRRTADRDWAFAREFLRSELS
jgi:RNA polymerase sigma factor (TIGR02999 family)